MERTWFDGPKEFAKEYKCKHCTKTSDNRWGLRSHYRVHQKAGEAPPTVSPDLIPKIAIDHHEPLYRPRQTRIEALKIVLKDLFESGIDWNDLDQAAETAARTALEWQHAQTGGSLAAEREDMTAEEVLVRIRSLVDNGMYERQGDQIRAQAEQIEMLEISLLASEENAAAAAEQAKSAKDTLETFRALINEQVPEAG